MKTITHWAVAIALLSATTAFSPSSVQGSKIKFNGLYRTHAVIKDGDTTASYLRFYAGGKMIATTSTDNTEQIRTWFQYDQMVKANQGTWTLKKKKFNASYGMPGKDIILNGSVKGKTIKVHIKSNINGYEADKEYYFVPDKK
ncbi:MAG: hypothetical protein JNL57_11955 [Bacteroidetes bacterium]|nr:hypothetical protein [Bacteroidota bacterium]